MLKVFISYRREDSADVTGRLFDHLQAHFGMENVFMDVDTIPIGVDFRHHLAQAVDRCDALLAVIGERWLDMRFEDGPNAGRRRLDDDGDFVRIEIEAALRRGIPVVPVLCGKALMPSPDALPEPLRDLAFRNAAELRSGRDFRAHVDRLIRGLDAVETRKVDPSVPPRTGKSHPTSASRTPPDRLAAIAPPAVAVPTNLRFLDTDASGHPVGWFDSAGFVGGVSTTYQARVEARQDAVGGECLLLSKQGATALEFGSWMQRCPSSPFVGKRIKVAARLRVQDVLGRAGIWLRIDGPDGHLFFDNMSKRPLRGTLPWAIHAIEADVTEPAEWLNFGVILSGDGHVWVSDVRIMVQDAQTRVWTVACAG